MDIKSIFLFICLMFISSVCYSIEYPTYQVIITSKEATIISQIQTKGFTNNKIGMRNVFLRQNGNPKYYTVTFTPSSSTENTWLQNAISSGKIKISRIFNYVVYGNGMSGVETMEVNPEPEDLNYTITKTTP